MCRSTTNTYQLKREILGFSNWLTHSAFKDQRQFAADLIYGVLGSESCVMSRTADTLQEDIRKRIPSSACPENLQKTWHHASTRTTCLLRGSLFARAYQSLWTTPRSSNLTEKRPLIATAPKRRHSTGLGQCKDGEWFANLLCIWVSLQRWEALCIQAIGAAKARIAYGIKLSATYEGRWDDGNLEKESAC